MYLNKRTKFNVQIELREHLNDHLKDGVVAQVHRKEKSVFGENCTEETEKDNNENPHLQDVSYQCMICDSRQPNEVSTIM